MALINAQSCICVKSELDLFSVPPTQTSIEQGTYVEYHPIAPLVDSSPIEFNIPKSSEDYIDLANSFIQVSAKVTNADGSDLADDAVVGPVNLFLHSMFSQVDMSLNGKLVTSSTNTYPYRAMMETLINYGQAAKASQLTAALYYKDTANHLDEIGVADAAHNKGLVKRARFTRRSRTVDLLGRIHGDMFFQDKLLLSGVDVNIKMTRSKDKFALMAAEDATYKVKIMRAVLHVRKVRVSPAVFLSQAKALEYGSAKYPIDRVVCKTFSIPAGGLDFTHENLFLGQIPTRVVVGCVDNNAYNGAYNKNPFNFKHYNMTSLSLQIDGQEQACNPIHTNFETSEIIRAYMSLFMDTGKAFRDEDIDISRDEYTGGFTLVCFDCTPDLAEQDHFNLIKTGSMRLKLNFAQPLAQTVNVVVYAEFQSVIEIDRSRNVFVDYSS